MNRKDVTKPQPREVNWVTHTRINLKDFIMILRCSHASCCSSSARCHGSSLLVIAYGRSCDNIIVGRGGFKGKQGSITCHHGPVRKQCKMSAGVSFVLVHAAASKHVA